MSHLQLMFQCPSCGSTEGIEQGSFVRCRHCGNRYTKELMDSSVYADLSYAMNERQEADFDKARRRYDALIAKYQGGSGLEEAYWGRFLCEQYVIFYQNDLDESIPSFWNINEELCTNSESYKMALTYGAESGNRDNYVRLAEQIEEYKAKYRKVKQELPEGSQVFICFKDTGTSDGKLGYRIYNTFARKYNVFFSKESLLDITGNDYEPYIYHGLTTAKVLLLLCSSRDRLESKWVHNEWWRFWRFSKGTDKVIIPIFREGFDASQLPDELRACQGIAEDIGLLSTLSTRLEAIFGERRVNKIVAEEPIDTRVDTYLEKARSYLSDSEFDAAADYCEQILRLDPMNGEAYLCRLLIDLKVRNLQELLKLERPFDKRKDYEKAVRYLPTETANALKKRNEILHQAKSKKNIRIAKWMGVAVSVCLCLTVAIFGIYSAVRRSRYEKGVQYLKEGNVREAYHQFALVGDYLDAQNYRYIANRYMSYHYSEYIQHYGLTEFSVPEGALEISPNSFAGCTQLTKVTIPDSVRIIGDYAFSGLARLTSIELPDSLTDIGMSAFAGCKGITSITIPKHVESIRSSAFKDCTALMELTISNGVTKIGAEAFSGCVGLTDVTIPESVTEIDNGAFSGCVGLTTLTIPEGVTYLGSDILHGCEEKFQSIILPKSLKIVYRVLGDLQNIDVFYCGTGENMIGVFGENSVRGNNLYIYSETAPATAGKYWRYVDGVPTPW